MSETAVPVVPAHGRSAFIRVHPRSSAVPIDWRLRQAEGLLEFVLTGQGGRAFDFCPTIHHLKWLGAFELLFTVGSRRTLERELAEVLLERQMGTPKDSSMFDRRRVPAAIAWVIAGIVTNAAAVFFVFAVQRYLWIPFLISTAGSAMFWGGIFMPFRIGWVGVVIGLFSQPILISLLVGQLMVPC